MKITKSLKIETLVLFVILIVLTLNRAESDETTVRSADIHYLLLLMLVVVVFAKLGLNKDLTLPKLKFIDIIPGIFLCVWLYGIFMGLLLGNNVQGIIRNFAAMGFYILYYIFLLVRVNRERLFKTVYVASIIDVGIALLATYMFYHSISSGDFTPYLDKNGAYRAYFSASAFVIFVPISVLGMSFLASKGEKKLFFDQSEILFTKSSMTRMAFLALALFSVIFSTASKGFILAFIFLAVTAPPVFFSRTILSSRFNLKIAALFVFLFALVVVVLSSDATRDVALLMFSSNEDSNASRLEQTTYILKEVSFFGKGLGAVLASGYTRDAIGYGFEVSYINVIHKFGIMSAVLFISYAYTLIRILKDIYRHVNLKYASAAMGAMCYLIPSIGNPSLFGSVGVTLHCIALYLVRENSSMINVDSENGELKYGKQ